MGRSPCCEKVGLKKGPWTPEEDQKLLAYIEEHGHGSWRALPLKAGLLRCGKSCRLRWTNYLRPDIKRGKFSVQEEQTIIQLHALLGNRWSAIATHLPKRTDNEIKNYWNTHLKKRLAKMGIDPVTHKPKSDALSLVDGQNKNAATLSHMAQWESARLEAEARLVRESKLRSKPFDSITTPQLGLPALNSVATKMVSQSAPLCLDVLKAWQGCWLRSAKGGGATGSQDLESPTSTLSFSENLLPTSTVGYVENQASTFELMENLAPAILCNDSDEEGWKGLAKCGVYSFTTQAIQRSHDNLDEKPTDITGKLSQSPEHGVGRDTRTATRVGYFDMDFPAWSTESSKTGSSSVSATATVDFNCTDASPMAKPGPNYMESFMNTDLLLVLADSNEPAAAPKTENSNDHSSSSGDSEADAGEDEENKSYWNTILHLVNSSPTSSSLF